MMERIFREFKKNKYTTIALVAFIILLVVGYFLYGALFGGRGKPSYGNRLDGIDSVMPSSSEQDEILSNVRGISEVNDVSLSFSGRTINIIAVVKDGTAVDKANTIPSVAISKLSSEQLSYFDVQVFIKSDNLDDTTYPIIAYKDKSSSDFSFTYNK